MSSPIERTSRADLNGAAPLVLLPGQRVSSALLHPREAFPGRAAAYTWAELAERVDVSIPTLRHWVLTGFFRPRGAGPATVAGPRPGSDPGSFAAVDVVRLEALARFVRSGVPVARAAELVRDPD